MTVAEKPVLWLGTARDDLRGFPADVDSAIASRDRHIQRIADDPQMLVAGAEKGHQGPRIHYRNGLLAHENPPQRIGRWPTRRFLARRPPALAVGRHADHWKRLRV